METFIAEVQAQNRIVIPLNVFEFLKLKRGNKIRVIIEKL
jgi:bifunctional DNA-binding transcriptional regulator/antitoxin component of YhaV-PrlF toxin-antitoxin module